MNNVNKVKKFFELVDSNAVGQNFQSALICNVRAYFEECFGVVPPQYPQISDSQKKIWDELNAETPSELATIQSGCHESKP